MLLRFRHNINAKHRKNICFWQFEDINPWNYVLRRIRLSCNIYAILNHSIKKNDSNLFTVKFLSNICSRCEPSLSIAQWIRASFGMRSLYCEPFTIDANETWTHWPRLSHIRSVCFNFSRLKQQMRCFVYWNNVNCTMNWRGKRIIQEAIQENSIFKTSNHSYKSTIEYSKFRFEFDLLKPVKIYYYYYSTCYASSHVNGMSALQQVLKKGMSTLKLRLRKSTWICQLSAFFKAFPIILGNCELRLKTPTQLCITIDSFFVCNV